MAWLRKHHILLGNIALFLVMLLGLAWLAFGSLGWRPWQSRYEVTVKFPISGGLQETSKVTLRGVEIGDVESLKVTAHTVDVRLSLDKQYKINKNATFSALALSGAGEQFVDVVPETADGPYLRNGDVIEPVQTKHTVPFSDMLQASMEVIAQVDTGKLSGALDELTIALNDQGPNQLRTLFNAAGTVFADLYKVMPQTTSLIQDAGTIFKTTAQVQPDFSRLVGGVSSLVDGATAADAELRTLLGTGPGRLTSLAGSVDTITDPITDVMGQLIDIGRQGALRAPALAELLPSVRDGSAAAQNMFHHGAWWTLGSIFPRPYCNYPVTPTRPTVIQEASVPTNLYCVQADPDLLRRGAAMAPRPEGDDTAGPPADYDPNGRTVPLN